MAPSNAAPSSPPSKKRRFAKRVAQGLFAVIACYALCIAVGLIPVNNGFEPSTGGVTIFVSSGPVHADLILPAVSPDRNWRHHFPAEFFKGHVQGASHIRFGWGDRGFYLETPEWKDLKLSSASKAILLPSSTVMHVAYAGKPRSSSACRAVAISRGQYRQLIDFIDGSFEKDARDNVEKIDFSYGAYDAFFTARGSYHAYNTCNCWVGRGLRTAGVRAPCFTPLPRTVLWYLPEPQERKKKGEKRSAACAGSTSHPSIQLL